MYARIARWEGDKEALDAMAENIRQAADSGPPEGVPATGFTLYRSLDGGTTVAIGFFETEEDLRQGDEALNAMDPPGEVAGSMRRVSVDLVDAALEFTAD
jgi:hypothetical protein